MEAGAHEQGSPAGNNKIIKLEIQQEMLDLIGWNMLASWKLKKKYQQ